MPFLFEQKVMCAVNNLESSGARLGLGYFSHMPVKLKRGFFLLHVASFLASGHSKCGELPTEHGVREE